MNLSYLRKQLDSKKISAHELLSIYLDRIKNKDNILNSFITVCEDEAIKMSKIAQERIDKNLSSMLTGIPFAAKDNISTLGIKTTCASRILEDYIPVFDATVIAKLKKENAVMLGKNNMDEFGMGSDGTNSYFGFCKNPYDIKKAPGGSSGGGASSVAASLCAFSLGSDTGGSVRQPAAMCGVTGLKPTYGAVSRYGLVAFSSSFDQIGIIANSAIDTGYVFNCIKGFDKNDMTTSKSKTDDCLIGIGKSLKGLKIGICDMFFDEISEDIQKAMEDAIEYYKSCGAEFIKINLPSLCYAVSTYYIISSVEASSNFSRFDGIKYGFRAGFDKSYDDLIKATRIEGFGKEVKKRIMLGNYALSKENIFDCYNKATEMKKQIAWEFKNAFCECDVILTPTSQNTAPLISHNNTSSAQKYMSDFYTVGASIAGLPAISTVCGYDKDNMPIGMSIIADAFCEDKIIAVCHAFEKEFKRQEAIL